LVLQWSKTPNVFVLTKTSGKWTSSEPTGTLRKEAGLTGPVEDAFMSSFMFVRSDRQAGSTISSPRGQIANYPTPQKCGATSSVADAPVKDDTGISDDDIASKNLILLGDPSSNRLLARMLKRLPLKWTAKELNFKGQAYDAAHHAPILIFPNPLNPKHYVVLNSGIDFRNDATAPTRCKRLSSRIGRSLTSIRRGSEVAREGCRRWVFR